jgi:hypothetical protein
MNNINLLRRALDTLDTFRQAYPENWHEADEQVMKDLMRVDLRLSGVKRTWADLTEEHIQEIYTNTPHMAFNDAALKAISKKLKELNT